MNPMMQTIVKEKNSTSFTPMQKGFFHRRCAGCKEHDVLRSKGQPIDHETSVFMEPRFGHDFSNVRIHTDEQAALIAQSINARAFTTGNDIFFDKSQYTPATSSGRRLLAHELTHVVQQSSGTFASQMSDRNDPSEKEAERAASDLIDGNKPLAEPIAQKGSNIQREDRTEEDRLRWPGMTSGPSFQLTLDPEIEARMMAIRQTSMFLDPDAVRRSVLSLSFSDIDRFQTPAWLTPATGSPEAPIVPRGAGPETPSAASAGDVARAVMKVPAVDSALRSLQTTATDRISSDWRRLSGGERAAVITTTALIGASALAGVIQSPEARTFVLGQLQNRDIPVPGVPGLSFQFNVLGPEQMLRFNLNVGSLLPPSWGFR